VVTCHQASPAAGSVTSGPLRLRPVGRDAPVVEQRPVNGGRRLFSAKLAGVTGRRNQIVANHPATENCLARANDQWPVTSDL